jgi:hypothetical protein
LHVARSVRDFCSASKQVNNNALEGLPSELGNLQALENLAVRSSSRSSSSVPVRLSPGPPLQISMNWFNWLPMELNHLPTTTCISLHSNKGRLPVGIDWRTDARPLLVKIFSKSTHIGTIRDRATTICIGLQDLGLPAPVTLEIIDADVCENNIRMWAKWKLITTIKHFHERDDAY